MGFDAAGGHDDLTDVRRRINSFPPADADAIQRRKLLTGLMTELLRRPEATDEIYRLLGDGQPLADAQSEGSKWPFGRFSVGLREIGLVAEALGETIVQQGYADMVVDADVEQIVQAGAASPLDVNDSSGETDFRTRARTQALRAIGWLFLGNSLDPIPFAGAIATTQAEMAIASARTSADRADRIKARQAAPVLDVGSGIDQVYRFRLPTGTESGSLAIEIYNKGRLHSTTTLNDVAATYGISLSRNAASAVLGRLVDDPDQRVALLGDRATSTGIVAVVDEIRGRLASGAAYVDVSGAKLTAWVLNSNEVLGATSTQFDNGQVAPLSLQDVMPGPGFAR